MGPLSLFSLYNGLLFIAWSVCIFTLLHIAFALFQVLSQRTVFFILRRCIASFLVCFTRPGVFTNPSCTIKRRKRTKKKNMESDSPRGLFGTGSCLSLLFFFITVQHCCFFRMQILGNGINWKEIHSPGIKHFLSHAFSLFLTGQVLEGFFFGTRLENRALGSETFMFFPFFHFFFF